MSYNFFVYIIVLVNIAQVIITGGEDVLLNTNEQKLKKIDLLNQILAKHFQSNWFLKEQFPTLEHGNIYLNNMRLAIKNSANKRLQFILYKAFEGKPVKIVVYGGSNTVAGLFPVTLQQWWDKNITPISGSVLKIKNLAIGGTASVYFQFCYDIYLNENEVVDLVILEVSVNDVLCELQYPSISRSLPLEQLTRQLLNRSNKPGVIFVNLYTLTREPLQCVNLMDFGQDLIVRHYNVTTVNLRDLACSFHSGVFFSTSTTYELIDGETMHLNALGHAHIAYMIVQVFMRALKRVIKKVITNVNIFEHQVKSYVSKLTPFVFMNKITSTIIKPQCWSNLIPNYEDNALRNTQQLRVLKSDGFDYVHSKRIHTVSYSSSEERKDAFGGFFARRKGSEITVLITVVPEQPYITRCVGVILRTFGDGGEVDIWLDDDYLKRINMDLRKNAQQTVVRIIATQVAPGNHRLTMRIVREGTSILVGVIVGPSDGPW